jgi:phosphocarrier protein
MKEVQYTISDPLGIHARPAGNFVKELQGFTSDVTITRGADSCDGKKLLALMKMRVKQGETISIKAEGPDEEACAAKAEAFLKEHL